MTGAWYGARASLASPFAIGKLAFTTCRIQLCPSTQLAPIISCRYVSSFSRRSVLLTGASVCVCVCVCVSSAVLPCDWLVYKDDASGQVYYHNTVVNSSSWEHPLSAYFDWLLRLLRRSPARCTSPPHTRSLTLSLTHTQSRSHLCCIFFATSAFDLVLDVCFRHQIRSGASTAVPH